MGTEVSAEQLFLRECHKVKMSNFDNSVVIPQEIRGKHQKYFNLEHMESLWKQYLHCKFDYLLGSLHDAQDEYAENFKEKLSNLGPPQEYMKEFIEDWKMWQISERLAFQYRISQLKEETVYSWWYAPQIPVCYNWIQSCRSELESMKTELCGTDMQWEEKLVEIYNEIPQSPSMDFHTESYLSSICRQALQEKTSEIRECLASLRGNISEISDSCQILLEETQRTIESIMCNYGLPLEPPNESFLAELANKLVHAIYQEKYDEEALIRAFLFEIRDRFMCEVCDYVSIEEDEDLVVWRVATVNHTDLSEGMRKKSLEDVRREIRERESYRRGEGISGTIVLQPSDPSWNLWNHIGSNDVIGDPRSSEKHTHAYKKDIYPGVLKANGEINNFWMFPIFRSGKIVGAFRVVNKLDPQGKLQAGGWPYFTRFELALVAQWFSKFLEAVQPQIQRREDSLEFFSWGTQVDRIMEDLHLDWIDRKSFSAILRHFKRISFMKEEKRRVGSSVLIAENSPNHPIAHRLETYPLIDIEIGGIAYPYHDMDSFLDIVDPLLGICVFDNEGKFVRIASLKFKENIKKTVTSVYDVISDITTSSTPSICIILPRDTRNISFYMNGKKIAELFLAERMGEWKYRNVNKIREILLKHSEMHPELLEKVLEASLELSSRRFGAIIVLGRIPEETIAFQRIRSKLQAYPLREVAIPYFVEFAKLDGATIIDDSGQITHVNTILSPLMNTGDLEIFPDRGSRHETGEKICRLAPKALVIVISENGGISILKDKKALIREDSLIDRSDGS
jgi:DNA integrity scanning protein DisA with diadenylate cyclase activity